MTTPDALAATVARDGGAALPLSTIYRNLEALEELGVVTHTHLDHRAPAYHLADHADHIHLVCRVCGRVTEAQPDVADPLVEKLRVEQGFEIDVAHFAIFGRCAECVALTGGRAE